MRFNDVFSKVRESRRQKTIRFHDLMPLIFSDDTKDKNGAIHSGKNGQFVSKEGASSGYEQPPDTDGKEERKGPRELRPVDFRAAGRKSSPGNMPITRCLQHPDSASLIRKGLRRLLIF